MEIGITTLPGIISLLILFYALAIIAGYIFCFLISVLFKRNAGPVLPASFNSGSSGLSARQKFSVYINAYLRYKCLKAGESNFLSIRLFLYRYVFGIQVGDGSIIYKGANIREPARLRIGSNSIIGSNAKLDARNGLIIGDKVNISDDVWIWTNQHDPQDPQFAIVGAAVTVEDYAWISSRVTILPGVTIAEGSVIATGAVVTKSTEPYTIYGGIPAKKIGKRNEHMTYSFHSSKDYAPFY